MVIRDACPNMRLGPGVTEVAEYPADEAHPLRVHASDHTDNVRTAARPISDGGIVLGTVVLIVDPHADELVELRAAVPSATRRDVAQGPCVTLAPVLQQERQKLASASEVAIETTPCHS